MHSKLVSVVISAALLAIAACATPQRGYVICNDLDANVSCPDDTANVVVGM
jgi:hypothetical protein